MKQYKVIGFCALHRLKYGDAIVVPKDSIINIVEMTNIPCENREDEIHCKVIYNDHECITAFMAKWHFDRELQETIE